MKRQTKEPPFGLVEHLEAGDTLHDLRGRLMSLLRQLDGRYGVTSKVMRKGERALYALDALRSELDEQCCRDLGERFSTRIYYPREPELPQEAT